MWEVRKSPHIGVMQHQKAASSGEEVALLHCVGMRWQKAVGEDVYPTREQSIYVCKARTQREIEMMVWDSSKKKEPTLPFGTGLSFSDKIPRL